MRVLLMLVRRDDGSLSRAAILYRGGGARAIDADGNPVTLARMTTRNLPFTTINLLCEKESRVAATVVLETLGLETAGRHPSPSKKSEQ